MIPHVRERLALMAATLRTLHPKAHTLSLGVIPPDSLIAVAEALGVQCHASVYLNDGGEHYAIDGVDDSLTYDEGRETIRVQAIAPRRPATEDELALARTRGRQQTVSFTSTTVQP